MPDIKRKYAPAGGRQAKRRLAIAVFAVVMVYMLTAFGRLHYLNYVEKKELDFERKKQEELRARLADLKKEKKNLEDVDYLKDYARRKLFLMDEKEVPIRIKNAPWEEGADSEGITSGPEEK